ncbi:hypothetical protein [Fibrobacter sp.]|uniref:hypothetical protein n=1 Tax=Fibrobacter sp. TaxID=35828 RepID=UPI00386712A8
MIKLPLKLATLAGLSCLFFACGEKSDSVRAPKLCPEGVVCDTTYVNAKAYSFVYYSGKDKLDTITETTDHISCDIWNGYFECTVRKKYSCHKVVDAIAKSGKSVVNEKSIEHKKVEVKVGDTTYINYGKHRQTNYIPPYYEIPPFDPQKLIDSFDTVVVETASYSDERLIGDSRTFLDYYRIEGKGLPNWAYVSRSSGKMITFDGKDGTPSIDTSIVSSDGNTIVSVLECNGVYYVKYPRDLVGYKSKIHAHGDTTKFPQKDTTVKWMAHYSDMYGVEDSLQIETLFRIKRKK